MAGEGGEEGPFGTESLEELERLNQAVEARIGEMVVVLLGRGAELDRRQALKTCLQEEHGVSATILIMEDYPDVAGEDPGDKWERLIETEQPEDFVVIVPEEGAMGGVGPEYGYIWGAFGDQTRDHVHFFWPGDRNPDEALDPYMGTMMGKARAQPFKDETQLCRRAYRLLQNLALLDVQGDRS